MKPVEQTIDKKRRDIAVVQFGEGNFLRGFADWMVDIANEAGVTDAGVAVVKPIAFGSLEGLRGQDGCYTVLLRGKRDGETVEERRVVSCVQTVVDCYGEFERVLELARLDSLRVILSNTTEAGIVYDGEDRPDLTPPGTFPGKLTRFLYERYRAFDGAADKGLVLLPVELIESNGRKLRECVLKLAETWRLPAPFLDWVRDSNLFCNTLVDRIVTGFPKEEAERLWQGWGYRDNLVVTGEPFALWVIESDNPQAVRQALPLDGAGLPVVFTDHLKPYRDRKVRLLNGGHTGTVLAAYLAGLDTVGQCMAHPTVRRYLERMLYEEIAPTVPLPGDEVRAFADSVLERFDNPFIRHELLSISLNSVSKWRARILPSLLDSLASTGKPPVLLTFSFAALLAFYRSAERDEASLVGRRGGETYPIRDDAAALDFFAAHAGDANARYVESCAANTEFWGRDLREVRDFVPAVTRWLDRIGSGGMETAMREAVEA